MSRKSEIIVIKIDRNYVHPIIKRIPVDLPWGILTNEAMGYMGENVIYDISGALYNLEKYKEALVTIKNNHDALFGALLFNSHGGT